MSNKKPKYGDAAFLKYATAIANHTAYKGMPDLYGAKGEIQWEAPSNRASGVFKDTNQRRRNWWRQRAISCGINPDIEESWLSKTAKVIHPFGEKPCKTCGRVMQISYSYPNEHLFNRLRKLPYFDEDFTLSDVEHIFDLIARLENRFGEKIYADLPGVFTTSSIQVPDIPPTLSAWKKYLTEVYIPGESKMLSPGAMANPPDRLDGFHSYNRCCRPTADKGRTRENLRTYVTDRRAFEYWVDGDWVSADRLMGKVRTSPIFEGEECRNIGQGGVHTGPCQADHIGPISLGFAHRPEFQLLCRFCNSGKNNRMYLSDVLHLIRVESEGQDVISWFAKEIWDRRKLDVVDAETALRLSKMLRDNRHTYMALLKQIMDEGHFTFLSYLLHLGCADYEPEFLGLSVSNHITSYDELRLRPRNTQYVAEQKARRIRVALDTLVTYHQKQNRNAFIVTNKDVEASFSKGMAALREMQEISYKFDTRLADLLGEEVVPEEALRHMTSFLEEAFSIYRPHLDRAKLHFQQGMNEVGRVLAEMWAADRYVRAAADDAIE